MPAIHLLVIGAMSAFLVNLKSGALFATASGLFGTKLGLVGLVATTPLSPARQLLHSAVGYATS